MEVLGGLATVDGSDDAAERSHSDSSLSDQFLLEHSSSCGFHRSGVFGSDSFRRGGGCPGSTGYNANRSSRASDTSSGAYSAGSDLTAVDALEFDGSGATGDSDCEDGFVESFNGSLIVRDRVREFLEKEPSSRTEEDIEVLLDFMQHLPAFSNMTQSMRRALCAVMVFVCIDSTGTVVHDNSELLKSWSVVLNGHLEILLPDGSIQHLHMGDSFGISPLNIDTPVYHSGVLRTKVPDCQFVTVDQQHFYDILHQGKESITRVEENGELVMVMEKRKLDDERDGKFVLRGTAEKLVQHLILHNVAADPTYIDDFLLTYRTFLRSPAEITSRLVTWFLDPVYREKAANIVLRWISSCPGDFDVSADSKTLWEFAEQFESLLETHGTVLQLRQFCAARSAHSCRRTIVLSRTTRDEILNFSVSGGLDKGGGVFVTKVEPGSKPYEAGLRRGDQILEVNNHNFERTMHDTALQILRGNTTLAITVRCNVLGLRDIKLSAADGSPLRMSRKDSIVNASPRHRPTLLSDTDGAPRAAFSSPLRHSHTLSKDSAVQTSKIRRALLKFNLLSRTDNSDPQLHACDQPGYDDVSSRKGSTPSTNSLIVGRQLYSSNPDLTTNSSYDDDSSIGSASCFHQDVPEHVVKVFRSDQSFRYLLIHKETTAREVVMLSLAEFGVSDPSCNYSLCEVSFGDQGLVKTRHLADQLDNLADRSSVNSRYYLRNNSAMENLVPDDLVPSIVRDATSLGSILLLRCITSAETAIQLTRRDFELFRSIEPAEYINDLFELGVGRRTGATTNLAKFSELVNEEMFWVATEVCSETNIIKRIRIIKQFIKIAKHCKTGRNFNSMFAILSGLGHGSVIRLKQTWDKLPSKYAKMFEEMQELMDPSRNMSKYRTMLNAHLCHTPVIPFFPLVKKDLTFIHFGNDSRVDGLVNFEKLRMIAKEVRQVTSMSRFESATVPTVNSRFSGTSQDCGTLTRIGADHNIFYSASASNGTSLSVMTPMRKKPSSAVSINTKKLFDEAQLSRRVRSYLVSLKVIDDEVKLSHLSQACEPPGKSTNKKTDPSSDSPSASFSPDIRLETVHGPLFGASSPDAVRKMMLLSDKVRPLDSKKKASASASNNPSSPQQQHPHLSASPSSCSSSRSDPHSPAFSGSTLSLLSPRQLNSRSVVTLLPRQPPPPAVDLSSESSSVTSVSVPKNKKTKTPAVQATINPSALATSLSHRAESTPLSRDDIIFRSSPQLATAVHSSRLVVVAVAAQSDSDSGRSSLASGESHSNGSLAAGDSDSSPVLPGLGGSADRCGFDAPILPVSRVAVVNGVGGPTLVSKNPRVYPSCPVHSPLQTWSLQQPPISTPQMSTKVVRPYRLPSYNTAFQQHCADQKLATAGTTVAVQQLVQPAPSRTMQPVSDRPLQQPVSSRPVLPDYYTATKMLAERRGQQPQMATVVGPYADVRRRARSCDQLLDDVAAHRCRSQYIEDDLSDDDEGLVSVV